MSHPDSSNAFVVLSPISDHGVIFGKNSDRPQGEVQEIVYFPSAESAQTRKCTYVEVEPSGPSKAVILSKPYWMWGAEMGANECGVVIGNVPVVTNNCEGDNDPQVQRLLGTDLVRLGLERSSSASEAVDVIAQLLDQYGQGGSFFKDTHFCAHNSFLIADSKCAWVLETIGKHWAAEQVTKGYRNISNVLTITTHIDKKSEELLEYAKASGLWDGNGDFNFSEAFNRKGASSECYEAGKKLLENFTASNNFKETDMFKILRDDQSEICKPYDAKFPTQCSQVSVLSSARPSVHWFTGTPHPLKSVFKPFVFTKNPTISKHTQCLSENEPHTLHSLHSEAIRKGSQVQSLLRKMEEECVEELNTIINSLGEDLSELDELFKDCVETEVKFYR